MNGTRDLILFYKRGLSSDVVGYTGAGYQSDLHNDISQIGFVFLHNGTVIHGHHPNKLW